MISGARPSPIGLCLVRPRPPGWARPSRGDPVRVPPVPPSPLLGGGSCRLWPPIGYLAHRIEDPDAVMQGAWYPHWAAMQSGVGLAAPASSRLHVLKRLVHHRRVFLVRVSDAPDHTGMERAVCPSPRSAQRSPDIAPRSPRPGTPRRMPVVAAITRTEAEPPGSFSRGGFLSR